MGRGCASVEDTRTPLARTSIERLTGAGARDRIAPVSWRVPVQRTSPHPERHRPRSASLREDTAMLARVWKGATAAKDADTYLAYLEETGLAAYGDTPGNQGVLALRRIIDGR